MNDLFTETAGSSPKLSDHTKRALMPLAARMRPRNLEEFIGQRHLLDEGKLLKRTILADRIASLIFYGPPGSGKTTLARIISERTNARFYSLNAVSANVQDIRRVIDESKHHAAREEKSARTILFIDEIHRFNKAQQDVLMPDVENGIITLIGSTTHNPSFSINGPLLSRSLIFEFKSLEEEELIAVLHQALHDPERGFGKLKVQTEEEALRHMAKSACGDARRALNALEIGVLTTPPDVNGAIQFTRQVAEESCQRKIVYYDHDEDYHYDTASAFIKSMRGSDPDSAVYWLAKMLYAGEDPRFIARRIVILASEDIGNADPQALILASSGLSAIEFVGMPEARIILSQLVTYMALAPKSNAAYLAIEEASKDVQQDITEEVPNHLRDASYKTAKKLGHGEGYLYPHAFPGHVVAQNYRQGNKSYYRPTAMGYEKLMAERLENLKKQKNDSKT